MPPGIDVRSSSNRSSSTTTRPTASVCRRSLFLPNGLDRSRRHPAIVWIHGDLVTQNYEGWHVRRDYGIYYSFHQYLLQRGYVVLAPRLSAAASAMARSGGRASTATSEGRTPGTCSLVSRTLKSLGFVDRIASACGLSYGGFSRCRR